MFKGDFMPIEMESKTGYVKSYKIDIIWDPENQLRPFFVVTLTDDELGTEPPEEFIIIRDRSNEGVNEISDSSRYYAVSYSNLIQAIIATVKEAFIHREKVIIEYGTYVDISHAPGDMLEWRVGKNFIQSIQIFK